MSTSFQYFPCIFDIELYLTIEKAVFSPNLLFQSQNSQNTPNLEFPKLRRRLSCDASKFTEKTVTFKRNLLVVEEMTKYPDFDPYVRT